MRLDEQARVSEAFGKLALLLGVQWESEEQIKAYLRLLSDLPADAVMRAIESYGRTATFPRLPLPGELRELAEGSVDDRAQTAWATIKRLVAKHSGASLFFEDAASVQAMLDTFNTWPNASEYLHVCSTEMETAKRKEFLSAYRRAQRGNSGLHYVSGTTEIQNSESISHWRERYREHGLESFPLEVVKVYVNGHIEALRLSCSLETGQLEVSVRRALDRGETPAQLQAAPERLQLPPAITLPDEVNPAEVRNGIALLQSAAMPGMTDEEWLAHKRLLKQQAEELLQQQKPSSD